MYIIAGLGNPGRQYENTRHNVGFDTVDFLACQYQISIRKVKHKGLIGEGIIQGEKVLFVKPQTFMNNSGECIREILEYYKISLENLTVIYDDIDLDTGQLRIRPRGSAGTHNGMKSIIYQLGSDDFPRIRIGIGKPHEKMDLAAYVLGHFTAEERDLLNPVVERAAIAAVTLIKTGVQLAMSKYNG